MNKKFVKLLLLSGICVSLYGADLARVGIKNSKTNNGVNLKSSDENLAYEYKILERDLTWEDPELERSEIEFNNSRELPVLVSSVERVFEEIVISDEEDLEPRMESVFDEANNGINLAANSEIQKTQICKCNFEDCGAIFKSKKGLERHKKLSHDFSRKARINSGPKIYKCDKCPKIYYTRNGLSNHYRMHTGRAFKCDKCDNAYTTRNSLASHKFDHSNICDLCGFKAKSKQTLIDHDNKKHRSKLKYEYSECGQLLTTQERLTKHKLIHEGDNLLERPKSGCRFRSNSKANLNKHRIYHEIPREGQEVALELDDEIYDECPEFLRKDIREELLDIEFIDSRVYKGIMANFDEIEEFDSSGGYINNKKRTYTGAFFEEAVISPKVKKRKTSEEHEIAEILLSLDQK